MPDSSRGSKRNSSTNNPDQPPPVSDPSTITTTDGIETYSPTTRASQLQPQNTDSGMADDLEADGDVDADLSSLSSTDSSDNGTADPEHLRNNPKPYTNRSYLRNHTINSVNTHDTTQNYSEMESINSSIPYATASSGNIHPHRINTSTTTKTTETVSTPTQGKPRARRPTLSSWFFGESDDVERGGPKDKSVTCEHCHHLTKVPTNVSARRRMESTISNPLFTDRRPPRLIEANAQIEEELDELSDDLNSLSDDDEIDPKLNPNNDRKNSMASITRTDTVLQKITSMRNKATDGAKERLNKMGFFDPEFEKIHLAYNFIKGYLFISIMISAIFSIFWGTMYNRNDRMKNLTTYVVLDNQNTYYYGENDFGNVSTANSVYVPDYLSQTLQKATEISTVAPLSGWKIMTPDQLEIDGEITTESIRNSLKTKVHHQKIFAALFVKPNSTLNFYQALMSNDSSVSDINNYIEAYYETGANLVSTMSYTSKAILELQLAFSNITSSEFIEPLLSQIGLTDSFSLNQVKLLSEPILFDITDLRPVTDTLVSGPQQYGLTYIHIVSLMQFQFFNKYHVEIEKKLNDRSFMIFRIGASLISYFVLSLTYTLVQIYFKIDIYSAYPGHLGFLIFWLVTFLIMAALGGVNENVVLFLQSRFPQGLAIWMFFWLVWNIAPTYYPLELSPGFYRYAYGFPMKNGFELFRILLFNTYKPASLARNVCVLLAWCIAMYAMLPYSLHSFNRVMQSQTDMALKERNRLRKLKRSEKIRKKLGINSTYNHLKSIMSDNSANKEQEQENEEKQKEK